MPTAPPVFGRILTAMVSPMRPDTALDLSAAQKVASWLVDRGNDGLVVNGTTGEAPTTTDDEKIALLKAVIEAVGDRATVVAGAGSYDTAHSVHLARRCAASGADGLLLVTPYYSKPPQTGLLAHFTAVADATELPVMLYDIPGRTATAIEVSTLIRLAEHPRIVAVKDAKGDLWAATQVMRCTELQWYSGDDGANLAHLAQGGVGSVGVTSHVASLEYAQLTEAVLAGDMATAVELHHRLVPVVNAMMTITQGAIMAKAALVELGVLDSAAVRLPLVPATEAERVRLRAGMTESGLR
ncbi:MAG TPA: 4-hydroxy-tetrahydrodipicolinate synthase [Dermatophilaceae bacterium]|nr:4-hydroxy-tetrahydrodipicolinate synthase [Dermatophilaceae bacterium]